MKWTMGSYTKSSKWIINFFIITALIFTSGCSLFPTEETEEHIPVINPPPLSQRPEYKVTRGTISITAKGTGKVFSNQEEFLYFRGSDDGDGAPGQNGETFRIKQVHVKPGDTVEAGDVLAELEFKDLDLEIQSSETDLKIAEQQLIQMLRQEVTNEEEVLQLEKAKADFRKRQIEHQKLTRKMVNSQITAPFSGQIIQANYSSGDQVKAYDPVFLLVNTNDLIVGARISANDQKQLVLGQAATISINGVRDPLKGKIAVIPDQNQNNSGGGFYPGNRYDEKKDHVLIDVGKLPEGVVRGTIANATITIMEKENVLKVPLAALRQFSGRNYVVVSDEDGKREVDVELGLQSATEVEIVSGLSEGQTILGR